jgi:GNAT superfamily N-acetyltransferase
VQLPPVTEELVRRLDAANDAFGVAWLEPRAGDDGTILRRFGGAVAAATPSEPELDFMNRIHFPWEAGPDDVDRMLEYYRGLGIRPWVELSPGKEALAARLAEAGARPIASYTMLYGVPTVPPVPAVEVEEAAPAEALEVADLLLLGHGVPEEPRRAHAPQIAVLAERDDITFYVVRIDGTPAAAAILALADGIGQLANASTLPSFRGRGCQAALIARRIADAAGAGCQLISAGAGFASQSQRNLERAGLRTACTRTVWRIGLEA